eukprot:363275-Chlamydomonas_euryale.AAC.13
MAAAGACHAVGPVDDDRRGDVGEKSLLTGAMQKAHRCVMVPARMGMQGHASLCCHARQQTIVFRNASLYPLCKSAFAAR